MLSRRLSPLGSIIGRAVVFCLCLSALPLLRALPASAPKPAEVFDASSLRQPRNLDMTWLVRSGDDPTWAEPSLDDSDWQRFDPNSSILSIYGATNPQPILWYRLHIKVDPTDRDLAISEMQIARAFETYVNGRLILASGSVEPFHATTLDAHLLGRIPDSETASGTLVLAVRARIVRGEWEQTQNPGLYGNNLVLGRYESLWRANWLQVIGDQALLLFQRLLMVEVGGIALILLRAQRRQAEYIWIAALGLYALITIPEPLIASFHSLPIAWEVAADVPRLFSPFLWTSLYFAFVHQRLGWRWRVFLAFVGVFDCLSAIQIALFLMPHMLAMFATVPLVILLAIIIPIVLGIHWRRGNREAGILLIPVVFLSLYIYCEVALSTMFQIPGSRMLAIRGMTAIDHSYAGPFLISLNTMSNIASSISLAVIMLLRFSRTSREQATLEAEFEAARQVQKVLLPDQSASIPGFAIDSVYEPARQVGGDFFQVLPAAEGGLLAVIGDVAGKGLPAALLVSVIVGAIRGIAGFTQDPAQILANLNERLVGRASGGFSTALALHISPDGVVDLANAGHLPPYLDGEELETPGALPLGIASGMTYENSRFTLNPGSRLTFFSDGVIEAQNQEGELLGFERSRELATRTAAEIVATAKDFGQNDDITVVTIARVAQALPKASTLPAAEFAG